MNKQTDELSYKPEYELPRETFVLAKKIGEWQFGKVFKGEEDVKVREFLILPEGEIVNSIGKK